MSADGAAFAVFPGGDPAHADDSSEREFQELWFSLATKPWASLVVVPADRGASAARVATALAAVGSRLRETSVTAIVAHAMDYASIRALTDIQPRLQANEWTDAIEVAGTIVSGTGAAFEPAAARSIPQAKPMPPVGRAVIAIQPVVDEPLGVGIAQAADAVVLCIELGVTRKKETRRTIELIGRERIIGAFIVR